MKKLNLKVNTYNMEFIIIQIANLKCEKNFEFRIDK